MITLSDFNSVFEVALAVNGLLVYFDISPRIDDHFQKLLPSDPGPFELKTKDGQFVEKDDVFFVGTDKEKAFVKRFGWRSILFKFADFKALLLFISAFNSLFALALLIVAGFLPTAKILTVFMVLMLICLFIPVTYLILYYYISFPKLKKHAASEARKELDRRKKEGISID